MDNTKLDSERTFDGSHLIGEGDILVTFNFNDLSIIERILHFGKVLNKDTNKYETSNTVAFYDENDKSYIGGINHDVFSKPSLFGYNKDAKGYISVLKKWNEYNDLVEIFDLLSKGELAKDKNGNLIPYKDGLTRIAHEDLLKLML